jgi:hypothetical protein
MKNDEHSQEIHQINGFWRVFLAIKPLGFVS